MLIDIGGLGEINDEVIAKDQDENFKLILSLNFQEAPIKAELFDCEQYIITIDDLVVQLIEALKFDREDDDDNIITT